MKRKRVLNIPLDRAWVVPIEFGLSFHQERDERLERACQHSAEWRLVLWCHEDRNGQSCDTLLGHVYATSEGDLWQAMIEGVDEGDIAFRKMFPATAKTARIRADLHAHNQWLDSGDDDLIARCERHGLITVKRSALGQCISQREKVWT